MAEKQSNLFLLMSNVAVVPAVMFAVYKKKFDSAAIIATVAVVSFLYHSCQAGFFCIFNTDIPGKSNFYLLQKSDEYFVSIAIVWFVLYAIEIRSLLASTLIFSIQAIFLLSLLSGKDYATTIVGVAIGVGILFAIVYFMIKPKMLAFAIVPSVVSLVLLASGFALFIVAGDPGDKNYWVYHSLWHIFLFLAVFFVLMTKTGGDSIVIDPTKKFAK